MYNTKKRIVSAGLCVAMLLGTAPVAYAQDSTKNAAEYEKYESVYAKLDVDGSASDAYIVNHFSVDKAGSITDYGDYTAVRNLTTLDDLDVKDGKINFTAEDGEFYYQGTTGETQLPWLFSIDYQLDGKEISAEKLAGNTGALKIIFSVKENPKADAIFYENYVMQVSLTLDSGKAKNIKAEGATIADAGADRQLSFTVLPGNDAEFVIEADIEEFAMSGFSIAAVPYSMSVDMDEFNTDDFTGQITELTDAVKQLNDGTAELADGISSLQGGNESLLDGSKQIQAGLSEISANSSSITNASSQIASALNTISSQLGAADFSGLASLSELPDGLSQLAGALGEIQQGLTTLGNSFSQAYSALDQAMSSATGDAPTEKELKTLYQAAMTYQPEQEEDGTETEEDTEEETDPSKVALSAYNKLTESYKQLQVILGTYKQLQPAFEAVISALDSEDKDSVISGIGTVASSISKVSSSMSELTQTDISGQMDQLKYGLASLASNYGEFHNGLVSYTNGIQTLSENYGTYQEGLAEYFGGVDDLNSGAGELSNGMNQFADGISDMPTQIENTIDEMMEQYNSSDFDAVSFADGRNTNITSVQFVISTKGIEEPKQEQVQEEESSTGFLTRLKALFTTK